MSIPKDLKDRIVKLNGSQARVGLFCIAAGDSLKSGLRSAEAYQVIRYGRWPARTDANRRDCPASGRVAEGGKQRK